IAGRHFHYDTRFLHPNIMDKIFGREYTSLDLARMTIDKKASQISIYVIGSSDDPIYHPFMCQRDFPEYPDASFKDKLQQQIQGERLGADKICRHQGMDLSGVRVKKGCLTCPMHGTEYDSTTGLARPCLMGKLK
ncbi:MAG: Rieske 2Fe-2S domain-containing protein, partial [Nanoarchaeota archaeon]